VKEAIFRLPPLQREALILFEYGGHDEDARYSRNWMGEERNKMIMDNNNCRFKLMLFVHFASTLVGIIQIGIDLGLWFHR